LSKFFIARDLPALDKNGLADPFCKLNIITQENHLRQKKWERTKTVHSSRNPEFNECIKFCGIGPEEILDLYVVLLDDDKFGHDLLGSTKISLAPVSVRRGKSPKLERS
jgi:rabphilin-3A